MTEMPPKVLTIILLQSLARVQIPNVLHYLADQVAHSLYVPRWGLLCSKRCGTDDDDEVACNNNVVQSKLMNQTCNSGQSMARALSLQLKPNVTKSAYHEQCMESQ